MTTLEDLAADLVARLPHLKSGSLAVFGDIFGGRIDNIHVIVGARAEHDCLVIDFEGGETLTVWEPTGLTATADQVRIQHAGRVRWEWFYYGREQTPENRFFIEHTVRDAGIEVTTDAGWGRWGRWRFAPSATAPAVEVLA